MKDIHYFLPITDFNKDYFYRIKQFKKYGLVNLNNVNISVDLIVGENEDFYGNDVLLDWDNKIEVKKVICPFSNQCQKLAWYYYHKLSDINAKWIIKIHDDSINDVGSTFEQLNDLFDNEQELYITSEPVASMDSTENKILKELNYSWSFFYREQEIFCMTKNTIKKIINCENAMKYFQKRINYPQGKSDNIMGAAGRISKIYPVYGYIFSHKSETNKFSLVGGQLTHIHFNNNLNEHNKTKSIILNNILNKPQKEISFFWVAEADRISEQFKLIPNGTIIRNNGNKIGIGYVDENNVLYLVLSFSEDWVYKIDLSENKIITQNKYGKPVIIYNKLVDKENEIKERNKLII